MSDRRSILVVDDDADLRDTVADAFEEAGYAVTTAGNGHEALQTLRAGTHPSVILLDLMMPEMDGWGFRAEQLRDSTIASIPVVVFTAYALPDEAAKVLKASSVLRKPILLKDLLASVERARPSS
jgi:two-component system response regulator MprA